MSWKNILITTIINILIFIVFYVSFFIIGFLLGYASTSNHIVATWVLYGCFVAVNLAAAILVLYWRNQMDKRMVLISFGQTILLYIIFALIYSYK